MLVVIKSTYNRELCRLVVQPRSLVGELVSMACQELGELDPAMHFIRPSSWSETYGLCAETRLPLILNDYILDTKKIQYNHELHLISYEDYYTRTPNEFNLRITGKCSDYIVSGPFILILFILFLKVFFF